MGGRGEVGEGWGTSWPELMEASAPYSAAGSSRNCLRNLQVHQVKEKFQEGKLILKKFFKHPESQTLQNTLAQTAAATINSNMAQQNKIR